MDIQLRRIDDADNFMEGDEHCRLYFRTEKIKFGTSSLLPGKVGAVDSGQNNGEEIFFMVRVFIKNKRIY